MEKKYRLLEDDTITVSGRTLHRIEALRDFADVRKGDKGGYVESEKNLSHEGKCWVFGNVLVFGNAQVYGNACVFGSADVCGNAKVYGDAWVYGYTLVCDHARVSGTARVLGNACVLGNAKIRNGIITSKVIENEQNE